MTSDRSLRHLGMVLWITVVWLALWGDLSLANLLGGVLVAVLLLSVVSLPDWAEPVRRINLVATARFAVVFARDLWVATLEVAQQVFWPVARLRPAVLEVQLESRDPGLLSLVANTITLTPGTLTLEVDAGRGLLYVHLLHLQDGTADDVVEQARATERLGARVLGIDLATPPGGAAPDATGAPQGDAARRPDDGKERP